MGMSLGQAMEARLGLAQDRQRLAELEGQQNFGIAQQNANTTQAAQKSNAVLAAAHENYFNRYAYGEVPGQNGKGFGVNTGATAPVAGTAATTTASSAQPWNQRSWEPMVSSTGGMPQATSIGNPDSSVIGVGAGMQKMIGNDPSGIPADTMQSANSYMRANKTLPYATGTSRVPGKKPVGLVDTVDAKLQPEEAVLNRGAAKLLGREAIDRLNQQGLGIMGHPEETTGARLEDDGKVHADVGGIIQQPGYSGWAMEEGPAAARMRANYFPDAPRTPDSIIQDGVRTPRPQPNFTMPSSGQLVPAPAQLPSNPAAEVVAPKAPGTSLVPRGVNWGPPIEQEVPGSFTREELLRNRRTMPESSKPIPGEAFKTAGMYPETPALQPNGAESFMSNSQRMQTAARQAGRATGAAINEAGGVARGAGKLIKKAPGAAGKLFIPALAAADTADSGFELNFDPSKDSPALAAAENTALKAGEWGTRGLDAMTTDPINWVAGKMGHKGDVIQPFNDIYRGNMVRAGVARYAPVPGASPAAAADQNPQAAAATTAQAAPGAQSSDDMPPDYANATVLPGFPGGAKPSQSDEFTKKMAEYDAAPVSGRTADLSNANFAAMGMGNITKTVDPKTGKVSYSNIGAKNPYMNEEAKARYGAFKAEDQARQDAKQTPQDIARLYGQVALAEQSQTKALRDQIYNATTPDELQAASEKMQAFTSKYQKPEPASREKTPQQQMTDTYHAIVSSPNFDGNHQKAREAAKAAVDSFSGNGAPAAPSVTPKEEYDKMPIGMKYVGPDGKTYIKGK